MIYKLVIDVSIREICIKYVDDTNLRLRTERCIRNQRRPKRTRSAVHTLLDSAHDLFQALQTHMITEDQSNCP